MENENTKWKELSIFSKGNNEDMHFEITLQEIDSFIGHDKTEEGWLLLKSLLSEKTIRSSVKLLDIIGKFLEKDIQEEKKEVYTLLLKQAEFYLSSWRCCIKPEGLPEQALQILMKFPPNPHEIIPQRQTESIFFLFYCIEQSKGKEQEKIAIQRAYQFYKVANFRLSTTTTKDPQFLRHRLAGNLFKLFLKHEKDEETQYLLFIIIQEIKILFNKRKNVFPNSDQSIRQQIKEKLILLQHHWNGRIRGRADYIICYLRQES